MPDSVVIFKYATDLEEQMVHGRGVSAGGYEFTLQPLLPTPQQMAGTHIVLVRWYA